MKKQFRQFIPLNQKEIDELWEKAIIVLDTNVLLQIYRYTKAARDFFLKILQTPKIKDRLWLPYRVGFEFHKNRLNVILEQIAVKDKIDSQIKKYRNEWTNEINKIDIREEHPFLSKTSLLAMVTKGINLIQEEFNQADQDHPDLTHNDPLLDAIHQLFRQNFGTEIPQKTLDTLKKEADERYRNKIGPGYEDSNKEGDAKYGDYLIWNEMIEKSKQTSLPIIFVTNDLKNDWWLEVKGKKIGINYELRREFFDKTGQEIILCKEESLTNKASTYLSKPSESHGKDRLLEEMRNMQKENFKKTINISWISNNLKPHNSIRLSALFDRLLGDNKEKILDIENKIHSLKENGSNSEKECDATTLILEKLLSDLKYKNEILNRGLLIINEINRFKYSRNIFSHHSEYSETFDKRDMERILKLEDELREITKMIHDKNLFIDELL